MKPPTALVAERAKEAPPIWTKSVTSQAVTAAAAEGRKLSAETSVPCDRLPEEEATCARCTPWTRMKNPQPVEAAATSQPARTTKSATAARVAPIGSGVPVEPLMTRAKASAMVPPAESIPVESGGGRPSQQSSSSIERILQKGPAPREDPQSDQFKSAAAVGIQKGLSALEGVTVATSSEEEGHNFYNQYLDLYIYGFPVSSFWFDMWIAKPLILHDREFIGPLQYLKSRGRKGCPPLDGTPNFSHEVTTVLNSHPGPIEYFRLDSSEWSSDQLLQWMRILRSKSVNEVIVVNIACSPWTSFPILEMHSTEKLSIGFFSITSIEGVSFRLSLKVLRLMCCSFTESCLYEVVNYCPVLEELHISFSLVNIRICSDSLRILQATSSEASSLIIESAPRLSVLVASIAPKKSHVYLKIDGVNSLEELHWIMLPYHQFSETDSMFKSLILLHIGINFFEKAQRCRLSKILEFTPMLETLRVMRMDKLELNELAEIASDGSFGNLRDAYCVKHHLRCLQLESFLGGDAETDLIIAVMRGAKSLQRVLLLRDTSSCAEIISKALDEMKVVKPISAECRIILRRPDMGN